MKTPRGFRNRYVARRAATVCGALFAILFLGPEGSTAQEIKVSPKVLGVKAEKGVSSPTATFYLTPSQGMSRLRILSGDLEPVDGAGDGVPRLMASQVTFAPATLENLEAGTPYRVIVSVSDLQRAGAWKGEIDVRWTLAADGDGAQPARGSLRVPLDVRYRTQPILATPVPPKIVLHGTVGGEGRREVTIRETAKGSDASGIRYDVEALATEAQDRMLPADAVLVENAPATVPGSGSAKIPVAIDLDGAEAGAYSGHLVVTSNAADLKIPVEITVRHRGGFALLVLGFGVCVAWGLTYYRTRVMPKDEVRVRVGAVLDHLGTDKDFDRYCGLQAVRPQLILAGQHLRKDEIDEAKAAVEVAEDLWDHWVDVRAELLADIAAIEALRGEIANGPRGFSTVPPILAIDQRLQETVRDDVPKYVKDRKTLVDLIEDSDTGWRPTIQMALELFRLLQDLKPVADPTALAAIERDFHDLSPASVQGLAPLLDRAKDLQRQSQPNSLTSTSSTTSSVFAPGAVRVAPTRQVTAARAGFNLKGFRRISFVLAIALLVIVGFDELYLDNPTFGADWVSDYFGLFLWGFGTEAGRAQVASLIKGWGVSVPTA